MFVSFEFSDVGPAVQAALRVDLHRPLADHLGLCLPCLRSAIRCSPYPPAALIFILLPSSGVLFISDKTDP